MSAPGDAMRLLPWSNGDGRPCYLMGAGPSRVSRVADDVERDQLDRAADLLDQSADLLAGRRVSPSRARALAASLARSLRDVHRVAESRGARLPPQTDDPGNEDDNPEADDPEAHS
ncbi:hypothetical protein [Streptomyces sp. CA-111067]|uniref:hypothetical protein n=1 Tax=Streptomyces sp. CA-111067 TaxID=3240046 RepID=UPI003D99AAE6